MEILQIESNIEKWEQLTDDFVPHIKDGEKPGFLLIPHHPIYKSLLTVSGMIHITCPDTDFILDIEIKSVIQFDANGSKPTSEDLFECYKRARHNWNGEIFKESQKRGFQLIRNYTPISFENLKETIEKTIGQAYNDN
jgi:hypothetical protein